MLRGAFGGRGLFSQRQKREKGEVQSPSFCQAGLNLRKSGVGVHTQGEEDLGLLGESFKISNPQGPPRE